MRQQPTAHPTPTPPVLVFTVNGLPTRAYLLQPNPAPPRLLVGELDGYQVVWTPTRHGCSCGRHPHLGGCPCITRLAGLADPEALDGWYRRLGWRQRHQLQTAPAARAATGPAPAGGVWPDWLGDLLTPERVIPAALLLALLLLLAPLLHR